MIKFFKVIAILEGFSFLFLLVNMLIVKSLNIDLYKTILSPLGITHGVLFIIYIVIAVLFYFEKKWNFKDFAIVCVASLIPFGTFYIEKKYL